MTPRHIAMGVALVGAAALVLFGDNTPDTGVVESAPRAPASTNSADSTVSAAPAPVAVLTPAGPGAAARSGAAPSILRLIPRATLIGDGDDAMGSARDVFGSRDWTPPPPPPPQAPPLPFTYIGKAVSQGAWEVYLVRGDQTFVVRDKAILDGTYRVDAIAPPILTLTYLPLNQVQQINIGVLD